MNRDQPFIHPTMGIARRHNLAVIEDAVQAIGAEYRGTRVGSFGTGCFSLYATKNVMSGEGGMITTDNDALAQRCRMIRNHGIGTGIFYPVPAHKQGYVREIVGEATLPVAEKLAREVISLPVHPQLSQADLETIVAEVNKL